MEEFETGSTAFFPTNQPSTPVDIFSRPLQSEKDELCMTDGWMTDGGPYNYNGQVIPSAALKIILNHPKLASEGKEADVDSGRLSGMIFVSERNDLTTLYISLCFNGNPCEIKVFSLDNVFGEIAFNGVHMVDSCCVAGDYVVYVITDDTAYGLQPWTTVYKTHLQTGKTNRITPPGQADLSPSVSPSGKKIAVASSQRTDDWDGKFEDLKTDIYVMNVEEPLNRELVVVNGGWPTWGSDDIIFFHRKVEEFWGVFRADISKGHTSDTPHRVTPVGVDAITPAAINATSVAVATISQKSGSSDKDAEAQDRHIEIFDSTGQQKPVQVTQNIRPTANHFNPFVIDGGKRIGYHRCDTDDLNFRGATMEVSRRPKIDKLHMPNQLPLMLKRKMAKLRMTGATYELLPPMSKKKMDKLRMTDPSMTDLPPLMTEATYEPENEAHYNSEVYERNNLEKLQNLLEVARSILGNAEEQQANVTLQYWLPRLEKAIYMAEYVLLDDAYSRSVASVYDFAADHFNRNADFFQRNADSRPRDPTPERVTSVLFKLENAVDNVLSLSKTDTSIDRKRRERDSEVYGRNEDRDKSSEDATTQDASVGRKRRERDSEVYGRNEDKENIVNLLLHGPGEHVPCVIIEGMTAIGKTTLAQLVYDDERVTQFYQANKVWVFVSHHFDAKKILTTVIECCTDEPCPFEDDLSRLHTKIERLLKEGRYLIVLDDVCIENEDDWEILSPLFQGNANGSRILITTQNKRVADTMKVSRRSRYNLTGLSEDQCYDVLKHHAFEDGEEETYPTLAHIGKEIARKCGGVALAAKCLGRLLHSKRKEEEWLQIRDNELWNLDEWKSVILPVLRLSYSRLPPHLRRCFAFCSIFPRGYRINKEKLVHLWMAGGLISYDNETQDSSQAEDTGREYFHDLLCMYFFEEEKQCDDGAVIGYKMPDAIYSLARSVSKSEYAIMGPDVHTDQIEFMSKVRHASLFRASTIPDELYKAKGLRTFILFSGGNFHTASKRVFSNFRYLHVLNLSGSGVEILDESSFSNLVHLRLLDLSYTSIKELPPGIKDLHFLHTLNVFHCYNIRRLDLEHMKRVKHLNNAGCKALSTMFGFSTPGSLYFPLERLALFVILWPEDLNFLQRLRLRGNLKITRLANVTQLETNQFLKNMDKLESLGLFWEDDDHHPNINPDEEPVESEIGERKQTHSSVSSPWKPKLPHGPPLAEGLLSQLRPPPYLGRLVISRYPGIDFPWEVPKYLNVIQLIGCGNIRRLAGLGDLPSLNSLLLQEMHALMCIERESCGKGARVFPELKELTLIDLPDLKEWSSPNVAGAFPKLRKLIISRCKATLVHSFQGLTSLEALVIEEVNDLIDFPSPFLEENPRLTSLEIKHCSQLRALAPGFEHLSSLQSLTIRGCENIRTLPEGIQHLTALQHLSIHDCPELMERCKQNGEDWPKIAHVLHIQIGG